MAIRLDSIRERLKTIDCQIDAVRKKIDAVQKQLRADKETFEKTPIRTWNSQIEGAEQKIASLECTLLEVVSRVETSIDSFFDALPENFAIRGCAV